MQIKKNNVHLSAGRLRKRGRGISQVLYKLGVQTEQIMLLIECYRIFHNQEIHETDMRDDCIFYWKAPTTKLKRTRKEKIKEQRMLRDALTRHTEEK